MEEAARKCRGVLALSSPLPHRAVGFTACKPRLSCDARSPAAPRRLLRPAGVGVQEPPSRLFVPGTTTCALNGARARSQRVQARLTHSLSRVQARRTQSLSRVQAQLTHSISRAQARLAPFGPRAFRPSCLQALVPSSGPCAFRPWRLGPSCLQALVPSGPRAFSRY